MFCKFSNFVAGNTLETDTDLPLIRICLADYPFGWISADISARQMSVADLAYPADIRIR